VVTPVKYKILDSHSPL